MFELFFSEVGWLKQTTSVFLKKEELGNISELKVDFLLLAHKDKRP